MQHPPMAFGFPVEKPCKQQVESGKKIKKIKKKKKEKRECTEFSHNKVQRNTKAGHMQAGSILLA